MVSGRATATTQHYGDRFVTTVCATTAYLLEAVQAHTGAWPAELGQQALHALDYAFKVPTAWPTVRNLVVALAPKLEQAGYRHAWLPHLHQAWTQCQAREEWQAGGEIALQLGLLYRLLSDYEQAEVWLAEGRNCFQQLSDRRGEARVLHEVAWIAQLRGDLATATAQAQAALALLDAADPERGMGYRVLGMVAIQQNEWKQAELLHQKALTYFEEQQDVRRIAWGTQNLAYAYQGQERFQEATILYQRALDLLEKLGDHYHWANVQMNLGINYRHSGHPDQAIAYHQVAEQLALRLFDNLLLAKVYVNLGLAFWQSKGYPEAQQRFLLAIQYYQKCGVLDWQLNAMDGLAMAYLANREFAKAIAISEEAMALLPRIIHSSLYAYLSSSLAKHLQEAQLGLAQ